MGLGSHIIARTVTRSFSIIHPALDGKLAQRGGLTVFRLENQMG